MDTGLSLLIPRNLWRCMVVHVDCYTSGIPAVCNPARAYLGEDCADMRSVHGDCFVRVGTYCHHP